MITRLTPGVDGCPAVPRAFEFFCAAHSKNAGPAPRAPEFLHFDDGATISVVVKGEDGGIVPAARGAFCYGAHSLPVVFPPAYAADLSMLRVRSPVAAGGTDSFFAALGSGKRHVCEVAFAQILEAMVDCG